MNNIIKFLFIATIALGTVSCSDDFLNKTPQDSLDPSKIGIAQLDAMRNSLYTSLDGGNNVYIDGYADNSYSRNSWDSHGALIQTNTITSDASFGYGVGNNPGVDFSNIFVGIRVSNQMLNLLEQVKVSDSIKTRYSAESRVIRAMLYMRLTLFYGDCPILESVVNDVNAEGMARTPKKEVQKWIIKELDSAIVKLPIAKEQGRISKSVAYAIKARAAYYFGDYVAAEDAALHVINEGGYVLNTFDYASDPSMVKDATFFKTMVSLTGTAQTNFLKGIFNYQEAFETDNNPEIILAHEYAPTLPNGDITRIAHLLTPQQTGMQAWNTCAPILDMVDAYWTTDGKSSAVLPTVQARIDNFITLNTEVTNLMSKNSMTFSNAVGSIAPQLPNRPYMTQFKNRDSRLYASIVFPFAATNRYITGSYSQYLPNNVNYGRSGFIWRKLGSLKDVVSVHGGWYFYSGLDFPLYRYAETLLIYAESHTHNTGYDGLVTTQLNKIRTRCGMPAVPTTFSKVDAVNFIRRERRIELAGEGLRYFDIRLYEDDERNGGIKGPEAASVVMQGAITDPVGNIGLTKAWAPRLMYMPIPSNSVNKNSAIIQNDGY